MANVKNAKLATKCDSVISGIHRGYERQFQSVMTLQMLVGQIPAINQQIESVMNSLGDLEALFGDVELALLGLEDTIDARELQERQLDQRFQMAMYQERRNAEFEELAGNYDFRN